MPTTTILRPTNLMPFLFLMAILLPAAPGLAQEETPADEPPSVPELVLPDSPAAALEMNEDLDEVRIGETTDHDGD